MMIVNFKAYRMGKEAERLIKLIEKYDKDAIVCLGQLDLCLAKKTKLKVFAQHVDYQEKGKNTGFLIPEAIKAEGVKGSLLNHSEHRISLEEIKATLKRCRDLNLKVVVCVSSLEEAKYVLKFRPYAIAFEDPDLIGTKKSIVNYKAGEVLDFVDLLKRSRVVPICGAGVSTVEDYEEAFRLGCKGVLISSAIAKSRNPVKLLEGIKNSNT